MYDSVYALARGLQSLERGATLRPVNVSCDEENPWNDGSSLFNYVNSVSLFVNNVLKFWSQELTSLHKMLKLAPA